MELTLEEKLGLLTGADDFWGGLIRLMTSGAAVPFATGSVARLGIGGLQEGDGPRGVGFGAATCFPVPMARAATFDTALEERVGEAIGREARAVGITLLAAPCVEVLRHPAWGRAQETYGEDPHHNGEMGAAFVRGAQRHVMACVKHLVCNSIENARFRVDVRVDPETLDNVYLVPYQRVVQEGVAAVMTAYNSVNGEWCGQNHMLITDVLKRRWGFEGFVVSDFAFSIRDGVRAILAGMDVELPDEIHFGRRLLGPVRRGEVPLARVDDAVGRLLGTQRRFARQLNVSPGEDVIACAEHRALAREVARRAIVLLKNDPIAAERPVLPLRVDELRRVAVLGRLADVPNTGDRGSSQVHPPYVVTPLAGLRAALERHRVQVVHSDQDAGVAADADVAVVVAGYTSEDEGEGFGGEFPPAEVRHLLPPLPPERAAEPRGRAGATRRRREPGGPRRRPPVVDATPAGRGDDPRHGRRQPADDRRADVRERGDHGELASSGAGDPDALVSRHGGRSRARRHRHRRCRADRPAALRDRDRPRAPAALRPGGLLDRVRTATRSTAARSPRRGGRLSVRPRPPLRVAAAPRERSQPQRGVSRCASNVIVAAQPLAAAVGLYAGMPGIMKPWSAPGSTSISNDSALCSSCSRRGGIVDGGLT